MELEKTDQEQVEELQKWWQENRLALLLGLVVGIGGLVGWEQWQKVSQQQSMAASASFDQVRNAIDAGNAAGAESALASLQAEHAGSAYVVDALSLRAAQAAKDGEWAQAADLLKQALSSGPEPAMAGLLRVRLARAQWAAGNSAAALATLDAKLPESFTANVEELRGDIQFADGQKEAAVESWERALLALAGSPAADAVTRKIERAGGAS